MPGSNSKRPGTERARDERRLGGARMHGGKWHDTDQPVSDSDLVSPDTVPEVEWSGDRLGMGRSPRQVKSRK